jgi:hypothetical protein
MSLLSGERTTIRYPAWKLRALCWILRRLRAGRDMKCFLATEEMESYGILMRGRQLVAATLVLILEDARYGNFVGRVFFGNRGVAGRAALSCDGGHGNNGGAARS